MTTLKRPNRNDVARHANVSGWTVSQVLNARSEFPISEDTRTRVHAAAKKLGYQPNRMARALVTGKTGLVSLWVDNLSPFYSLIVRQMHAQIRTGGVPTLITEIMAGTGNISELSWSVDGIIAVEYPAEMRAFREAHPKIAVPFVSMGAFYIEEGDYVGVDLAYGIQEAMAHLFARGRRRVVFALNNRPGPPGEARFDTYNRYMHQTGLEPEYLFAPSRAAIRQHLPEWMAKKGKPDAIVCHNDDLALGVYRGLCDLGVRVPDDVALVGCDGMEETEYLERPLTTIVQPVEEMCALAWEYLSRRMADPTLPVQQIVLRPELAVRDST